LKQLLKILESNVPYRAYFELGTKKKPPVFLNDETYGKAIQSLVVVAADAVPINRERRTFYLAKRIAKPIQGWWELGGRICSGEPESEAISRIVKRETSVKVSPERFILVSQSRYFLKDRQQEPQDAGNDTFCYHFAVELTDDELIIASANLDENEYERSFGLREFDREKIVKKNVELPILDLYDTVFP
jgi:ADP-ribose pyrophosphatase YjhB (NUDIX family)